MPSNEESAEPLQIIITLALLGIIVVIGGIGNVLVIVVYKRKLYSDYTADFFIIVLAISDLIVCLVIVPCTMAVEYLTFNISSLFCKTYYFLNTTNLLFSTLLISAVALDRYLCICHPFRQYLTIGRSIKLIGLLALVSFGNGIMSTFNVEVRPSSETTHDQSNTSQAGHLMPHSNPKLDTKYVCDEIVHFNNVTASQKVFYKIVEKINHTVFIGSILSVIVLYSFIFRVVVKIRRRDKLKETSIGNSDLNNFEKTSLDKVDNETVLVNTKMNVVRPKPRTRTSKSNRNYNRLVMDINKKRKKAEKKQANASRQNLANNVNLQNMKSAAMLFVVVLVYIIAFSPVLLIVTFKFPFNLILYNLYYLNNAANPLIYCFMNSKFRKELATVFLGRSYTNDI